MDILTSIHGRRMGLGPNGELILNSQKGLQTLVSASAYKLISSAQLLALNATPQTIIPAPGAGFAIVPLRMAIHKPAGTAYAADAGEDLVLKYTGTGGAQCSGVVETTGFLTAATVQTRVVGMPGATGTTASDFAPVANAPVVLHLLSGEVITGTSPLHVRVWYDVIQTAFTA